MTRSIIHIDMDAFYASVEQRDDPKLKGKPVIVGGDARRGVVLAASYEVRPFGVRSAMPMARAMKLAPQAIVVRPRFDAYVDASEQVFRIFERYTPLIEPLSLDEAFLDVTACQSLFGTARAIATRIREEIRAETQLAASAGIADCKFVAKIASDFAKPDGLHEVPPGTSRSFLEPLPVSRLWGVGPKTEAVLQKHQLFKIGDVAARSREWLINELGSSGAHFWELGQGIDDRPVIPDRDAKSIGAQDTFEHDLSGVDALAPHLHSQALRVGRRLRKSKATTHGVQLTVKYADFTLVTRRMTLDAPTDDGQLLYRVALSLLNRVDLNRAIRLTGVSACAIEVSESQMGLFTPAPTKSTKLNEALDSIAAKFGSSAVRPADLSAEEVHTVRDGFYREEKRERSHESAREREQAGPRVIRDDVE